MRELFRRYESSLRGFIARRADQKTPLGFPKVFSGRTHKVEKGTSRDYYWRITALDLSRIEFEVWWELSDGIPVVKRFTIIWGNELENSPNTLSVFVGGREMGAFQGPATEAKVRWLLSFVAEGLPPEFISAVTNALKFVGGFRRTMRW